MLCIRLGIEYIIIYWAQDFPEITSNIQYFIRNHQCHIKVEQKAIYLLLINGQLQFKWLFMPLSEFTLQVKLWQQNPNSRHISQDLGLFRVKRHFLCKPSSILDNIVTYHYVSLWLNAYLVLIKINSVYTVQVIRERPFQQLFKLLPLSDSIYRDL